MARKLDLAGLLLDVNNAIDDEIRMATGLLVAINGLEVLSESDRDGVNEIAYAHKTHLEKIGKMVRNARDLRRSAVQS